jgi:thiol-disulfide isomerase/thioredoxin
MLRPRRVPTVVLALVLLLAGWTGLAAAQGAAAAPPEFGVSEGLIGPDFTMLDLDGRPTTLSDLRGRPVLLNFWASWCPPCVAELPLLNRLAAERDDLAVVLLNVGEPHATVAPFLAELDVTAPIALRDARDDERPLPDGVVPSRAVAQVYQTYGLPTSLLIDERGVIVQRISGAISERMVPGLLARLGLEP